MCSHSFTQLLGASKGVCLSHAHILSHLKSFDQPHPFRLLSFSPIFWSTGLISTILVAFRQSDTRIITTQSFSVELLIQLIKAHDVNFFQAAPYQLTLLVQSPLLDPRDFVGVQAFCALGSIVSENLRKEFRDVFPRHPLIISYGMSESCITISATSILDRIDGLTVGSISHNIHVKVIDKQGLPLDIGETGEILAKPEFKFMVSASKSINGSDFNSILGLLRQSRGISQCRGRGRLPQNWRHWLCRRQRKRLYL